MKLHTSRFGEIEFNEEEIITFSDGLFGFEDIKKYIIFQMEEDNPLMWMQSIEEGSLAFIIIRPFEFNPNYSLQLSDNDVEELGLTSPDDSDIFAKGGVYRITWYVLKFLIFSLHFSTNFSVKGFIGEQFPINS